MANEHVNRFIEALAPQAIALGEEYNLDPLLILSQGALESGWGKKTAGNNVFGVKSHGQPGGQSVLTHEEVNGRMVPMYQDFRVYDSPAQSMRDYAQFLSDNPRYKNVFGQSGSSAIDAVAAAGYATDSSYADKLKAVARMIDLSPYQNSATPLMAYSSQRLPTVGPTGGPALSAINAAAPQQQAVGFWSQFTNPVRNAIGLVPSSVAAPITRMASTPQVQQAAIGPLMGSLAGRNVLMRGLMNMNIGASPTITPGAAGPGTRAVAVSNQGASPVIMTSNGGSGAASSGAHGNWNPDVYRANTAVLGSGGHNQASINNALSQGKTLYKLA